MIVLFATRHQHGGDFAAVAKEIVQHLRDGGFDGEPLLQPLPVFAYDRPYDPDASYHGLEPGGWRVLIRPWSTIVGYSCMAICGSAVLIAELRPLIAARYRIINDIDACDGAPIHLRVFARTKPRAMADFRILTQNWPSMLVVMDDLRFFEDIQVKTTPDPAEAQSYDRRPKPLRERTAILDDSGYRVLFRVDPREFLKKPQIIRHLDTQMFGEVWMFADGGAQVLDNPDCLAIDRARTSLEASDLLRGMAAISVNTCHQDDAYFVVYNDRKPVTSQMACWW